MWENLFPWTISEITASTVISSLNFINLDESSTGNTIFRINIVGKIEIKKGGRGGGGEREKIQIKENKKENKKKERENQL